MKPNSFSSSEKPLVCRPHPALWIGVALLAFLALVGPFMAWKGDPRVATAADWGAMWAMTLCFGLPGLVGGFVLGHHRIIADREGLTFQGFHRRRSASWPEIEDFELRVASSNESAMVNARDGNAYLRIRGKWQRITLVYTHYNPLLERIAEGATASRTRVWELSHLRENGDWPKTFEYRDVPTWHVVAQYLGMVLLLLLNQILQGSSGGWAEFVAMITLMWQVSPPLDRVGMVGTLLLSCGALPLVRLTQLPAIRTRRGFLSQKIIATPEGIALFRDDRKISLAWTEIDSYHLETMPGNFQPDLCIIKASDRRICFVSGISDTKTLLALVQNRAINAQTAKWLHLHGVDEDVLGGAASFYREGKIGVGPKIYHYRTRTTRIFLVFGLILSGLMLSPFFTGRFKNPDISKGDIITELCLFALIGGATLLGFATYRAASLVCEAEGLRQRSVWGERLLPWGETEKLVFNGYYYRVSGQNCSIRFGLIADYEGLIAEIEKRSGVELKRDGNAV